MWDSIVHFYNFNINGIRHSLIQGNLHSMTLDEISSLYWKISFAPVLVTLALSTIMLFTAQETDGALSAVLVEFIQIKGITLFLCIAFIFSVLTLWLLLVRDVPVLGLISRLFEWINSFSIYTGFVLCSVAAGIYIGLLPPALIDLAINHKEYDVPVRLFIIVAGPVLMVLTCIAFYQMSVIANIDWKQHVTTRPDAYAVISIHIILLLLMYAIVKKLFDIEELLLPINVKTETVCLIMHTLIST